jgi:cytochrome bd ubiquinol oxidase subunit I
MNAVLLSRIQFGLTIAFHYIYPPMTIGLGLILVVMEGLYLKTRDPLYRRMIQFWVRVFGLIFALGVATGIVMEFEFGTNWAAYSRFVGDVFGSALAAEGVFAFFMESGFLAILLFGWHRVKPITHFIATVMVCLGAHFSAVWIVVANSWMQTPAGFRMVGEGAARHAEITDFWAMVLNPSSAARLAHTVLGCWQAGAFLVLSVSAYYLLRNRHTDFAKASLRIALAVAAVASLASLGTGHWSGRVVARYQPVKLAAMEGLFASAAPAGAHPFGWVDLGQERVLGGFEIPGTLSWMVAGDPHCPLQGLKAFPREDWPPVNAVFQSFHLMVMIGMALIGLSLLSVFLWWRGALFQTRWVLWLLVFSVLGPQAANQLGWFTAEVGRQPWIVQGLLRTADGASRSVPASHVLVSLVLFTLIYVLLFALFIYLLDRKIKHGPDEEELTQRHLA